MTPTCRHRAVSRSEDRPVPQPQHPVGAADHPLVVAGDDHRAPRVRGPRASAGHRRGRRWRGRARRSARRPPRARAPRPARPRPRAAAARRRSWWTARWSARCARSTALQRRPDVRRSDARRRAATWRSCSVAVRCGNGGRTSAAPRSRSAGAAASRVAGPRGGQVGAEHVEVAGAGTVAGGDQVQQAALAAAGRARPPP